MRQAGHIQREHAPSRLRRPLAQHVMIPLKFTLLPFGQLRRGERHLAYFFHQDSDISHGHGKFLIHDGVAARVWQLVADLHFRLPRRERAGHGDAAAARDGLRRAGKNRSALRVFRQVEGHGRRGHHGGARRVLEIQQVIHLQHIVGEIENDARLVAKHHHARHRLQRGGRWTGAFERGHEQQADPTLRRRGKFLRLEPLAVHGRDRLHACAAGDAAELGAAVLVGVYRSNDLGARVQLNRMIRNVIR